MADKLYGVTVANSIGNVASGTALTTAHTAAVDGFHVVSFKCSAAAVYLQVTENDGSNNDTSYLNNGQQIAANARHVEAVPQKSGHTYTYAMVYSSGTPVCDVFQIHEYDERPSGVR